MIRFIKSHTPLDGLPYDARVSFMCVGLDPRDVGISFGNFTANMDPRAVQRAREAAIGVPAKDEISAYLSGPQDESERDEFRRWMLDAGRHAGSGRRSQLAPHVASPRHILGRA